MVEKIKDNKDQVLRRMEQVINERGPERMDVQEMGKLADIVKDLAEAEKSCWEAEYYRSVTEAMESSGYMPEGMGYDGQGGSGGGMGETSGGRSGWQNQYGSGRGGNRGGVGGRGGRRGYDPDPMQAIREAMRTASPEERERMTRELRQMINM